MRKALLIVAALSLLGATANATQSGTSTMTPAERLRNLQGAERVAVICFKKGETVDGMNKICFYDCLGSASAITISSVSLCPLTIDG